MSDFIIDKLRIYIVTELGLSQETLSAYTQDAQELLIFAGTPDLNSQHIVNFINHLRGLQLSPTTIRRKSMSIRCLCHCLISCGLLDERILAAIDPIKTDRRSFDVLDCKDIDFLVSIIESSVPIGRTNNIRRNVAIVLLAYHSGLRVSEICNVKIGDINFDRREIRVLGKGNCERIVPTTRRCIKAVAEYIDLDRQSISQILFVKANGGQMTRRAISDMVVSASRRAGVKHATAHTLRRSCATTLLSRGMDTDLIRVMLGHRDLSSTQSYLVTTVDKLKQIHGRYHPFGANREN